MTRRDALLRVIDALHDEIAALKSNDVAALDGATKRKLAGIEALGQAGTGPAAPDLRELADEADRLNETARIYVNLMAANVRRRLQVLTGNATAAYRPGVPAYA
jgi:hypothetical protein